MNPSKGQARKMVLVSAFLLAAIALYRNRRAGDDEGAFRALWGVGVVSLVLSLVADFAPRIAGPFAGLTVLGSLTSPGNNLIQAMLGTVAVTPSPGAAAHPDSRGPGAGSPGTVRSPNTIRGGN